MNQEDEVIKDEVIKNEIDKLLLPVMPTAEIPENCVVRYRSELEPGKDEILIVEVLWRIDETSREGIRCAMPIDRRAIGRYSTDQQGRRLSARIIERLNSNHSNI